MYALDELRFQAQQLAVPASLGGWRSTDERIRRLAEVLSDLIFMIEEERR